MARMGLKLSVQLGDHIVERSELSRVERPQDLFPPSADDELELPEELLAVAGQLDDDLATVLGVVEAADVVGPHQPVDDAGDRGHADVEALHQRPHGAAAVGADGGEHQELRLGYTAADKKVQLHAPDDVGHELGNR